MRRTTLRDRFFCEISFCSYCLFAIAPMLILGIHIVERWSKQSSNLSVETLSARRAVKGHPLKESYSSFNALKIYYCHRSTHPRPPPPFFFLLRSHSYITNKLLHGWISCKISLTRCRRFEQLSFTALIRPFVSPRTS